jgi:catechol 2,3-dioxygenase-like lactoylglutathione lyase family enzyme
VPVTVAVRSMVASTYVRDIDASRRFYEILGFRQQTSGRAETSAWSYLRQGEQFLLLAWTLPPLDLPLVPLLFYFFIDDLESAIGALDAAGTAVTRVGRPPHALGGEVKITDPDG